MSFQKKKKSQDLCDRLLITHNSLFFLSLPAKQDAQGKKGHGEESGPNPRCREETGGQKGDESLI